jgi:hypothetical protein
MPTISEFRRLGQAASAQGFERMLEHFLATARIDPARVVAEARRQGLPVGGDDVVSEVGSLRALPVERLDRVALGVVRTHTLVAGAQGFVTGAGGIAALPLALSADTVGALYWVVRSTSGVMNSYGFETLSEEGMAALRVGLLLAMGVGTVTVGGRRVGLERISRQVLSTPHSQQLLVAGGRQLARRLSVGAVHNRAAARAVPLVGGAISGAINAGMVRGVSRRAAWHYRGLLADWQGRHAVPALPPPPPSALPPVTRPGRLELPTPPGA